MATTTTTHFRIRTGLKAGGGWLSPEGWAGYYERLKHYDQLPADKKAGFDVYGPEQCMQHIKQLRETTGYYAGYCRNVPLVIEQVTTTVYEFDIDNGQPTCYLRDLSNGDIFSIYRNDNNFSGPMVVKNIGINYSDCVVYGRPDREVELLQNTTVVLLIEKATKQ